MLNIISLMLHHNMVDEGVLKDDYTTAFCRFIDLREEELISFAGFPQTVELGVFCNHNKLTSLEGCPKNIGGDFDISDNHLTSLENIHRHIDFIDGILWADLNPITSNVLGLLKIKGIDEVRLSNHEVEVIINKYLPLGDVLDCQEELIENGLEEFARL